MAHFQDHSDPHPALPPISPARLSRPGSTSAAYRTSVAEPQILAAPNGLSRPAQNEVRPTPAFPPLPREVIGLFGLPIDISDTETILDQIYHAVRTRSTLLISTVNVNFLVTSRDDMEFRATLLGSDLCTVDGMPLIWIARMLGVRIRERVAGSDIFERMKESGHRPPTEIFLFGGDEGVAEKAGQILNSQACGACCTGTHYPGFGSVAEMSAPHVLEKVNRSRADFLAVALGAKKGQAWLYRNHERLQIPVRAHLGATLNFQAGTVKRAPTAWRRFGFEWLWRILQEPKLWTRYVTDGLALGKLFCFRVLPLALILAWHRRHPGEATPLSVQAADGDQHLTLHLVGPAAAGHVHLIEQALRVPGRYDRSLRVDMTGVTTIDLRFIGMLAAAGISLSKRGHNLILINIPPSIRRIIRLTEFEWLAG